MLLLFVRTIFVSGAWDATLKHLEARPNLVRQLDVDAAIAVFRATLNDTVDRTRLRQHLLEHIALTGLHDFIYAWEAHVNQPRDVLRRVLNAVHAYIEDLRKHMTDADSRMHANERWAEMFHDGTTFDEYQLWALQIGSYVPRLFIEDFPEPNTDNARVNRTPGRKAVLAGLGALAIGGGLYAYSKTSSQRKTRVTSKARKARRT